MCVCVVWGALILSQTRVPLRRMIFRASEQYLIHHSGIVPAVSQPYMYRMLKFTVSGSVFRITENTDFEKARDRWFHLIPA